MLSLSLQEVKDKGDINRLGRKREKAERIGKLKWNWISFARSRGLLGLSGYHCCFWTHVPAWDCQQPASMSKRVRSTITIPCMEWHITCVTSLKRWRHGNGTFGDAEKSWELKIQIYMIYVYGLHLPNPCLWQFRWLEQNPNMPLWTQLLTIEHGLICICIRSACIEFVEALTVSPKLSAVESRSTGRQRRLRLWGSLVAKYGLGCWSPSAGTIARLS